VRAVLFCTLGLVDDLRPLSPLQKLVAQVVVASLAVILGLRLRLTGVDSIDAVLAGIWIVACVNAFNVTDVCDGLVTGLAATFFLAWILLRPGSDLVAVVAFGACAAFLVFNAPRASMFLGDAGSHLLGFLVAAKALESPAQGLALTAVLPLLVFVPVAETLFLTVVRLRKGIPWYKGSQDHFALRLQSAGWSRWAVDVAAWFAMACVFVLGIAFERGSGVVRAAVLLAVGAFCAWVARFLLRHEVKR
jgi:UDP-GlcNAc:undecaprenyl-phosphate GlcNAc-1-phosphate transferase